MRNYITEFLEWECITPSQDRPTTVGPNKAPPGIGMFKKESSGIAILARPIQSIGLFGQGQGSSRIGSPGLGSTAEESSDIIPSRMGSTSSGTATSSMQEGIGKELIATTPTVLHERTLLHEECTAGTLYKAIAPCGGLRSQGRGRRPQQ